VVEGENPVVAGEGEEVADGGRDRSERRSTGVDEGAEKPGGEGFAGGRRALEDKEWERAVGTQCGQEPSQAAEPGGAGRKIEAGSKGCERRAGIGRDRRRK
jgi:hypothetical protein